jgi:hypothetical protein
VFLPKYSPDLNDIEHDFSALTRARMYAPLGTLLEEIIRTYFITYCLVLIQILARKNYTSNYRIQVPLFKGDLGGSNFCSQILENWYYLK